jgi:hypothetical protein
VSDETDRAKARLIKRAPEATARLMFETVKQAAAECGPDERYELVREIYDWALTAGGEIGDDFHVAYLVCLDGRIRDEEAQRTLGLLMAVRHVISVEPVGADDEYRIARVQERYRLHKLLMGALDGD